MAESIVPFFQQLLSGPINLLLIVYLIAITTEAMSGALVAGQRNMDIFGVVVIAFVTALGGGTIRDVVLGNYPIVWTQHPEYAYLVIFAGLVTTIVARFMHRMKKVFFDVGCIGPGRFFTHWLQRRTQAQLPNHCHHHVRHAHRH